MTGHVIKAHEVVGAGRVYLVDYGDEVDEFFRFDVIRVDPDGFVMSDIDDCLIGPGEAADAYLRALEHLYWLATPAGRNAARDVAVDDALRGRDAHPAGKGGGHGC